MSGTNDVTQPGADDKDKNKNKDQNDPAGQGDGGGSGEGDGIASLEDAKKIIKNLRKENADNRAKNKSQEDSMKSLSEQLGTIKKHLGIEDEKDPTEKIQGLTSEKEALELELSLQQLARANSIPVEQDELFRFLISKKFAELEKSGKDGDELSEDAIKEVVAEVQKYAGFKKQKPNNNRTGVDDGGDKDPSKDDGDAMTAEQFAKLPVSKKMEMYSENKAEYDRLFAAAKEKRLI